MLRENIYQCLQRILTDDKVRQIVLNKIQPDYLEIYLGNVFDAEKLSDKPNTMETATERFRRYGGIFKEAGCDRKTIVTWVTGHPKNVGKEPVPGESFSWIIFYNDGEKLKGVLGTLEKTAGDDDTTVIFSLSDDYAINFSDRTVPEIQNTDEYKMWSKHFCELMLLTEVWANNRKMIYDAASNMFMPEIAASLVLQRMQKKQKKSAVPGKRKTKRK